jgi:hypothetical protein
MQFKVNAIVSLQDARYCAAQGVQVLSFAQERGSHYYLPPETLGQIIGWLNLPQAVLDYGLDREGADAAAAAPPVALGELNPELELILGIGVPPMPHLATAAPLWLRVVVETDTGWAAAIDTLRAAFVQYENAPGGGIRGLELAANFGYSARNAALHEALAAAHDLRSVLWLDIDAANDPLEAAQLLRPHLCGLSLRTCVSHDLHSLDYDAFEALSEALQT